MRRAGRQGTIGRLETVVRIVGSVISGVFSSGELLISLLSSSVRVVGQMANAMAQVGLVEKSGSGMCVFVGISGIFVGVM